MSFKVSEIFRSIQGESSYAGLPCSFIRLAGCNLRCRYCDTRYAQEGGADMSMDEILEQISTLGGKLVEVTGGEPLLQEATPDLTARLVERGYKVLIETNGSLDISVLPEQVVRIVDVKCPSSGENHSVRWENMWGLRKEDQIKFVISDRHDYEWARGIVAERFGAVEHEVLFSTVFGELPPRNLVKWILEDGLAVRFQLQIHKYIWPHTAQGV